MKIVADSSCDLTAELKKELDVTLVPLTIRVGEKNFRDDETLNLDEMMRAIKAHDKAAQSAYWKHEIYIPARKSWYYDKKWQGV